MALQCKDCKVDMDKKMQKVGTDGTPVWRWKCPQCGKEVKDGRSDESDSEHIDERAEAL